MDISARHHDTPDDPIPPLRHHRDMAPIISDVDLRQHWRMLMGPLGFGGRALWVQVLDQDGRCTPVLTKIEDLPSVPAERELEGLAEVVAQLLAGGAGCEATFLLSRPGRGVLTSSDRTWARELLGAMARRGVCCRPVHLATDEALTVVAVDDLLAAG